MLEHDTCPGRPEFSLVVSFAEGLVETVGQSGGQKRPRERGRGRGKTLGGCFAVPPPPRTRCHQAQLGTSPGHQRVYARPFPRDRAVVCVSLSSDPRDGASFFPITLFLSLIPFHSPMRLSLSLSLLSLSFFLLLPLNLRFTLFFLLLSVLSMCSSILFYLIQ